MNERLRHFLIRFIDLRSDREIIEAVNRAEAETENLTYEFMTHQISHEEYGKRLDVHFKNPDAHLDLRRAGEKLGIP